MEYSDLTKNMVLMVANQWHQENLDEYELLVKDFRVLSFDHVAGIAEVEYDCWYYDRKDIVIKSHWKFDDVEGKWDEDIDFPADEEDGGLKIELIFFSGYMPRAWAFWQKIFFLKGWQQLPQGEPFIYSTADGSPEEQ